MNRYKCMEDMKPDEMQHNKDNASYNPNNIELTPIYQLANMDPETTAKTGLQLVELFEIAGKHRIDWNNPETIDRAIIDYFRWCGERGVRPSNQSLYLVLGVRHDDVRMMLNGSKSVSTGAVMSLKRGLQMLSAIRENAAITGHLNPATWIFSAKNYDGLTDSQQIEVRATAPAFSDGVNPDNVLDMVPDTATGADDLTGGNI